MFATTVFLLVSLVCLLALFAYFYKPGYPKAKDLDPNTFIDDDGWEFKYTDKGVLYVNGPKKGQLIK